MGEKLAEEMFIEDGEFNEAALRGAFEKWVDRDWTYGPGTEASIVAKDAEKPESVCFKSFDNWINRQVDDDWFDDVKFEYGKRVPREVFYDYWENNDEFRKKVRSHIEGTEEWYERRDEEPEWEEQQEEEEEDDGGEKDQSSFGASQFPQLHDLGVVGDSAGLRKSKLRGLAIAFADDVEEIRGESREFEIKWAQHAFLYWGSDKFGDEWIKFIARHTGDNAIYEAVKWVYNNKDGVAEKFHRKYRGNFELEVGNPDTDEVSEAFLDIEDPGWDEEEEQTSKSPSQRRWDKFEEEATNESNDTEGQTVSEDNDDSDADNHGRTSTDTGSGVDDDDLDQWEKFEKESQEANNNANTTDNDDRQGEDGDRDTDDTDGGSDTVSDPGSISEWGEAHGTVDKEDKPSRTRERAESEDQETTQQSESKDVQQRQTTAGTTDVECEDGGRPYEIQWPDVDVIDEFERNRIYEGNTFEWGLKLPENSVDTMVTSPPYYALRDYDIDDAYPISGSHLCDHDWDDEFCTKCGAFLGQLGHEPDPASFIDHIVDLMERYKRVLKPSGSLWLNIGDTYAGNNFDGRVKANRKSRMMIPERVYRRMVQTGWHLRDYVIWVKKIWMPDDDLKGNGKPFAGSSRLADQWEPMVRFTPQADHYSDVDSNRLLPPSFDGDLGSEGIEGKFRKGEDTQRGKTYNELGTNPPDVWLINSDGYDGDHRAVFPEELPKRCINISTPDRVCKECGRPYDKEVHVKDENVLSPGGDYAEYEPRCNCDAGHQPGVAFDPFLGSGTTAVAAANNGFDWAGVELSEKYQELARERIPTGRQVGLDQW